LGGFGAVWSTVGLGATLATGVEFCTIEEEGRGLQRLPSARLRMGEREAARCATAR
jgi:hypothetical protein